MLRILGSGNNLFNSCFCGTWIYCTWVTILLQIYAISGFVFWNKSDFIPPDDITCKYTIIFVKYVASSFAIFCQVCVIWSSFRPSFLAGFIQFWTQKGLIITLCIFCVQGFFATCAKYENCEPLDEKQITPENFEERISDIKNFCEIIEWIGYMAAFLLCIYLALCVGHFIYWVKWKFGQHRWNYEVY
eukprot:UN34030